MSYVLIIILCIVGVVVLFFITFFVVALTEKVHLRRDMTRTHIQSPHPVLPYLQTMNELAAQLQFTHCGDFFTEEGKSVVRGNVSFWLSPDKITLCEIAGAQFMKKKFQRTRLLSQFADGRILETKDEVGTRDLTGVINSEVLLNADLPELHELHLRRIQDMGQACQAFSKGNALEDIEAIELERGSRLVDRGLARYVGQDTIRHSIRGAFLLLWHSVIVGPKNFSGMSKRIDIKRPGHPKYRLRQKPVDAREIDAPEAPATSEATDRNE